MKDLTTYIFLCDIENALKLIQNGADINEKYGTGIRPIIAAINSDKPETLRFVIQHGADVNIDFGEPTREAIDYCIDGMIQNNRDEPYPEALEMLQILLENGAYLELSDANGKRPIDVIEVYAHDDQSLAKLKSFFRHLIPNIEELIKSKRIKD